MIRITHARHVAWVKIPYPHEIFQFSNAKAEVRSCLLFMASMTPRVRFAFCLN